MNQNNSYAIKYISIILFALVSLQSFGYQQELEKQISLRSILPQGHIYDTVVEVNIRVKDLSNILKIGVSYSKDSTFIDEHFIELSIEDLNRPEVQNLLSLDTAKKRDSFQKQMAEPLTLKISHPTKGISKKNITLFYEFKYLLNDGEGGFKLLAHLDYGQHYFFRVFATDNNGKRHFTKTKSYKTSKNRPPEESILTYVYLAVVFIFYGSGLYLLIFPITLFTYLYYFKKIKFTKSLKHMLLYILLSLPIVVFLNFIKLGRSLTKSSFSTELYMTISLILLGLLYIRILKKRNGR